MKKKEAHSYEFNDMFIRTIDMNPNNKIGIYDLDGNRLKKPKTDYMMTGIPRSKDEQTYTPSFIENTDQAIFEVKESKPFTLTKFQFEDDGSIGLSSTTGGIEEFLLSLKPVGALIIGGKYSCILTINGLHEFLSVRDKNLEFSFDGSANAFLDIEDETITLESSKPMKNVKISKILSKEYNLPGEYKEITLSFDTKTYQWTSITADGENIPIN